MRFSNLSAPRPGKALLGCTQVGSITLVGGTVSTKGASGARDQKEKLAG